VGWRVREHFPDGEGEFLVLTRSTRHLWSWLSSGPVPGLGSYRQDCEGRGQGSILGISDFLFFSTTDSFGSAT
jgi:hypothetical protein